MTVGKRLYKKPEVQESTKKYNNVQEEEGQELPEVKQGEPLKFVKIDPQQNFTQPPGRFTEAMLIKLLEEKGIGRPSTYAPIVSTIQDRDM